MEEGYELTRLCLQRSLAFVYFFAFLVAANQNRALIGSQGLLPIERFLKYVSFGNAPSLFWISCTDRVITWTAWFGVFLSSIALTGLVENSAVLTTFLWLLLWVMYLSFVNVGQIFYGFGWESQLLEMGFLAIFLGPSTVATPTVLIFMYRWILFRVMFGAGLIKLRGDRCWRALTCLYYHYETQPIPNPLSWYFHHLPKVWHRAGVAFNHVAELIIPFGFFAPAPYCYWAGGITILFQVVLILSGNLSFLNYVTLVLCFACFDDAFFSHVLPVSLPEVAPIGFVHWIVIGALTLLIGFLSIRPALNLFSTRQKMNASFDSLHLVNTYGAFGSITKRRMEIIVEGTDEINLSPETEWKEYEFKAKPGRLNKRPSIVSPYHLRLDWLMWFAAMSSYHYHPWVLVMVKKILLGDRTLLKLLGKNPFEGAPPKYVRATLYFYEFTSKKDESGNWWKRKRMQEYLHPLALSDFI